MLEQLTMYKKLIILGKLAPQLLEVNPLIHDIKDGKIHALSNQEKQPWVFLLTSIVSLFLFLCLFSDIYFPKTNKTCTW